MGQAFQAPAGFLKQGLMGATKIKKLFGGHVPAEGPKTGAGAACENEDVHQRYRLKMVQ